MRMRANGKKFLSILTTYLDTTTRNVTAVFKSCGKSGRSPCWLSSYSRTQEQGVGGNHYQLCRLHLHLCTATLLYSWIGGKRCLRVYTGKRKVHEINPLIMLIQSEALQVHVDPHTKH